MFRFVGKFLPDRCSIEFPFGGLGFFRHDAGGDGYSLPSPVRGDGYSLRSPAPRVPLRLTFDKIPEFYRR